MKKLYTLFILAFVAVVANAQESAQLPFLSKQTFAKETPFLVDGSFVNAKEWTGGKVPANALRGRRASSHRALSSLQSLVCGYKTTQAYYDFEKDEDADSETAYTFLLQGEGDNEIVFTGLVWGYDVTATVNLEDGTFEIPHQFLYTHSQYGAISLTLFFYYEGDDDYEAGWYYSTGDAIGGWVNEDGTLEIGDYYCLTVDKYVYQNKTYENVPMTDLIKPSVLTPTNGAMVVMTPSSSEEEDADPDYDYVAVELSHTSNSVSVVNFAGYGETLEISLKRNNTLTIAKQLLWQGGDTYGNFYTYSYVSKEGATKYSEIIGDDPISGEYNADYLSWGPWVMYSYVKKTRKEYGMLFLGGMVFYTDGTKFPDPSSGIAPVKAETNDGAIYSIDGRRLSEAPAKGLYIQNGKKYIAK